MVTVATLILGVLVLFCLAIAWHCKRRPPQILPRPAQDWPAIPVATLALFQPQGRINQWSSSREKPVRVTSFEAAQDRLMARIEPRAFDLPDIVLRLSKEDAGWTDILLNGALVVQVSTEALVAKHGSGTQRL